MTRIARQEIIDKIQQLAFQLNALGEDVQDTFDNMISLNRKLTNEAIMEQGGLPEIPRLKPLNVYAGEYGDTP